MNRPSPAEIGAGHNRLIHLVLEFQEEACLTELQRLLAEGHPPMNLLDACIEGVRRVGELFEQGEFFIAALIMAGEIMRRATEVLSPYLEGERPRPTSGTVLLGTIQGDIHDLGKNLFALLLQANGFTVEDLGVDVPPERFVARARELHPDLVGISSVLTFGLDQLKATVQQLHAALPTACPPVLIGGASVDQQVCRYTGADHWARDAAAGLQTSLGYAGMKNPSHNH